MHSYNNFITSSKMFMFDYHSKINGFELSYRVMKMMMMKMMTMMMMFRSLLVKSILQQLLMGKESPYDSSIKCNFQYLFYFFTF